MNGARSIDPLIFRHVPHEPGTAALEARSVTIRYGARTAIEKVSFVARPGDRIAVVGPNGAGKTTLLNAIAGLHEPDEGELLVFGYPPRRHACIAYLTQRHAVDWHFPATVRDVVMMGRVRQIGLFRRPRAEDHAFVDSCLALVGLTDLANRRIDELSGGQQQRMFIARALAQEAALVLFDEPFTGLDRQTEHELLRILDELSRRGVCLLVSTHDLDLAANHFDRVLLLHTRLVAFGPPAEVLTAERLTATFGSSAHTIRASDGTVFVNTQCCGGGTE